MAQETQIHGWKEAGDIREICLRGQGEFGRIAEMVAGDFKLSHGQRKCQGSVRLAEDSPRRAGPREEADRAR